MARERAEASASGAQELSRRWWEQLPMTYTPWEEKDRQLVGREDFERAEKEFLESNPWIERNVEFRRFRGQRVLEIGCGCGTAACLFARAGASVTAIDITGAAVELTARNARAQGLSVRVCQMDAERTGFDPGGFDYVFSWGVLHHTGDPSRAFKEVSRVLAPSGRGLIMVYNRLSLRYYCKGLHWLLVRGKLLRGYSLAAVQRFFTDGYYHKHFTHAELAGQLCAAGLTTTRIAVTHMAKRMIPVIPEGLDQRLKRSWGWLLVAEFQKIGVMHS